MGSLERELGDLNGQLKILLPALNSVDDKLTTQGQKIAGIEADIKSIRDWVNSLSTKITKIEQGTSDAGWGIAKWFFITIGGLAALGLAGVVGAYFAKGGHP